MNPRAPMSALHVLLATVLWLQYNSRQNGVARSDNLKGISLHKYIQSAG
jgi:hypothetical protein